jgi:site-specific recombinase XerD
VSVVAVEPRFTLSEWSRIVGDPTRDNAYQHVTRLGGAVAKYLAWKRLSASARTLSIYEGYLAALCVFLASEHGDPELLDVTPEMLLAGAERHPVGSYKLVRTAYREFFAWAEEWEHITRSPARRLPRSLHQPVRVYDVFTLAEQSRLVKAAEQLPLPWVQRLRVRALVDLGIRSKEARYLRVGDVDAADRVAIVRAEGAKGGKERIVPFGDDFHRAFMAFANRPVPAVRTVEQGGIYRAPRRPDDDDHIFFPLGFVKATGAVSWTDPARPLSDRAMRSWWDKVVASAGVRYRSLHMNRHTLATNLSDAGEGIETIGEWLGHADPKTTKVYVHNSRSRLQRGRSSLDAYRKAQGS